MRTSLFPLFLFGLALSVRLGHLYLLQTSPLFDIPIVDTRFHLEEALTILNKSLLGSEHVFYKGPLFSYFMAGLFGLFDVSLSIVRIVNILIGSGNVVLIYLLGSRWMGKSAGLLAGILASVYGPFVFFDCEILIPPLLVALLLLTILCLTSFEHMFQRRWLFMSGLLLGLATLTRPNAAVLVPVICVWIYWICWKRVPGFGIAQRVAIFCLTAALVVLPATLRNYVVAKDLVGISWNGGINFYIGNQPCYDQTSGQWNPDPTWERIDEAPFKLGLEKRSQISRFYYNSALKEISRDPAGFLWRFGHKLYLFWTPYEISNNQDIYHVRNYSCVLSTLLWKWGKFCFPFNIIGPLSLMGLFTSFRRDPALMLPVLFILTYMISIILFFNTARYRIPVIYVLMPFCAAMLLEFWRFFRQKQWRSFFLKMAILIGLSLFLHMGVKNKYTLPPPEIRLVGQHYKWKGNRKKEFEARKKDVMMHPDDATALYYLGDFYLEQEDHEQAEALFRRMESLKGLKPDWTRLIHMKLGWITLMQGRHDQAISEYAQVVALDPDRAYWRGKPYFQLHAGNLSTCDAEYMMAIATAWKGDLVGALEQFRRIRSTYSYYPQRIRMAEAKIRVLTQRLGAGSGPVAPK